MSPLQPLVIGLVGLAGLGYLAGIGYAGWESWTTQTEPVIAPPITQLITGIGGVLATHFGVLFGIAQREGAAGKPMKIHRWAKAASEASAAEPSTALTVVQVAAAYLYIAGLLTGSVFWLLDGFSKDSAEIIRSLFSTLIGVLVGILAVSLGRRQ